MVQRQEMAASAEWDLAHRERQLDERQQAMLLQLSAVSAELRTSIQPLARHGSAPTSQELRLGGKEGADGEVRAVSGHVASSGERSHGLHGREQASRSADNTGGARLAGE